MVLADSLNKKWMQTKFLECSLAEDYSSTLTIGIITTLKDNSKDNLKETIADKISKMILINSFVNFSL
jgi:hypothetical protein